jgi:hypothetical protein
MAIKSVGEAMYDSRLRDITADLAAASSARQSWSPVDAAALLDSIAQALPGSMIDWDRDAGEEWGRIVDHDGVVAFVRARTPLVILARARFPDLAAIDDSRSIVIVVDDVDDPSLTASKASIEEAFPERRVSASLDLAAFSAMELWFATT